MLAKQQQYIQMLENQNKIKELQKTFSGFDEDMSFDTSSAQKEMRAKA